MFDFLKKKEKNNFKIVERNGKYEVYNNGKLVMFTNEKEIAEKYVKQNGEN